MSGWQILIAYVCTVATSAAIAWAIVETHARGKVARLVHRRQRRAKRSETK